jgi:hypothetical protein
MINRETWERQFKHLLKQKLGIGPEEVGFHWRQYYNERYTPEGAIVSLMETHRLYPALGVLPETVGAVAEPTPEIRSGVA